MSTIPLDWSMKADWSELSLQFSTELAVYTPNHWNEVLEPYTPPVEKSCEYNPWS